MPAVARTFLISFFVIFCLALPARAENVSAGHLTPHSLGQVTVSQTGVNAYRRNLNRLRGTSQEEARSHATPPPTKDFSASPQLDSITTAPSEQQQQTISTEQQPKFSFKEVFQKKNPKKNPVEAEEQPQNPTAKIVQERPTQPQGMSAYEIVQAARQPYNGQAGTAFSRPNLPQISPSQFSEHISELHTSLRQQPERLNKTVVEPLQGKIAALKEQASTTAKTTFKEQIERRGLAGRELIDNSGVGDRIRQTKTTLKASVVDMLKHVETKAHKTAEQLNDSAD